MRFVSLGIVVATFALLSTALSAPALATPTTTAVFRAADLAGNPTPRAGNVTHAPILIDGNAAFTAANGVTGGSGTSANPYVIANWSFTPNPAGYELKILNTRAHFVVHGVSFAAINYVVNVFDFENVTNGTVTTSNVTFVPGYALAGHALYFVGDSGITVTDLYSPRFGADIVRSSGVTIANSTLGGSPSIEVDASVNVTLSNNFMGTGIYLHGTASPEFTSHHIDSKNDVGGLPVLYYSGCTGLTLNGTPAAQILLAGCNGVRIANEPLVSVYAGIQIGFSQNVTVDHNNWSFDTDGLDAYALHQATITHNEMFQGQNLGITLNASSDVTVYGNDFVGALRASDVGGTNDRWNASYPIGGNFWGSLYTVDRCHGPLQDDCSAGDGLGDSPYTVSPGAVDAYPVRHPLGFTDAPPVPLFTWAPTPVHANESIQFDDSYSYDPDGSIFLTAWDFSFGWLDYTGGTTSVAFPRAGVYNVTLTLWDTNGVIGQATQAVTVEPPVSYPRIFCAISRPAAYVGDSITFNASRSFDLYGTVTSFNWSFGDGSVATGPVVEHAYSTPGTYVLQITGTNDRGYSSTVNTIILVFARPVLVPYTDWSGFRLLVPSDWTQEHNVTSGGANVTLALLGPTIFGIRTNVVEVSASDVSAQETKGYLSGLVNATLAGVRQQFPDMILSGPLWFTTVGNHSAAFFELAYPQHAFTQAALIVVSAAHQREWEFVLTSSPEFAQSANETFWAMVAGFAITLPPLATLPAALSLIAEIVGTGVVVAVIVVVLYFRRRGRRPDVLPAQIPCLHCGATLVSAASFCGNCGQPIGGGPPPPAAPPPERPPP